MALFTGPTKGLFTHKLLGYFCATVLGYNIRSVYYTSLAVILDVQIIVLGKQQNSSVKQRGGFRYEGFSCGKRWSATTGRAGRSWVEVSSASHVQRSAYTRSSSRAMCCIDYREPSAKAPVIQPGDEALFLVWGGEGSAQGCLTEVGKPGMLGIDVLT